MGKIFLSLPFSPFKHGTSGDYFALALDILSKIPISHNNINKAVPPVTEKW